MSDYKTDLEIAREAKKLKISEVASNRLSIDEKNLVPYGHFKAKLDSGFISELSKKDDGKLILVTAMTPTTAGEGKTTTSVGLTDGLNFIGKKAMVALREPSLGPCFGMKGGAAGGDMHKLFLWKILIYTLLVIFMQLHLRICFFLQ